VWELPGGVLRTAYSGHGAAATALAWSPDSRWVATGGGRTDRTLQVWEPRSGRLRHTYRGHHGRILALSWSPQGDRIASSAGDEDGTMRVWRPEDPEAVTVYSAHSRPARELQWSPDGGRIAAATWDGELHIWDASTGAQHAVAADERGHLVSGLSWAPDGREVAALSWRGVLRCWEPRSQQHVRSLHSHGGGVDDLAWSHDGGLLAAGGRTPVVEVWDTATGALVATREADSDQQLLAWSPNSARLAGRQPDGRLFVLDVHTGDCVVSETDQWTAMTVVWSPDGSRLATAGQDDTAHVFDAASLRLVTTHRGQPGADWVRLGRWSPDSRHLLSTTDVDTAMHSAAYFARNPDLRSDPRVHVWDAATGGPVATYAGHRDRPSRAHWSPNGALVASVDGLAVHVWEPFTGRQVLIAVRDTIRRTWSLSRPSTEPGPGRVRVSTDEPDPATVELQVGYPADSPMWSPDGRLTLANSDTVVRLR
jgi:WD40 repeat protein